MNINGLTNQFFRTTKSTTANAAVVPNFAIVDRATTTEGSQSEGTNRAARQAERHRKWVSSKMGRRPNLESKNSCAKQYK